MCGGDYPDCPHYFFAELTLERFENITTGEAITLSFDFWEVDPIGEIGVEGAHLDDENVKFYFSRSAFDYECPLEGNVATCPQEDSTGLHPQE